MQKIFLILLLSFTLFSKFNHYGGLGYINTPSALSLEEGLYALNLSRNKPDRMLSFTASPFDWLDASIFYVDIARKPYVGFYQSYKDKGFNIKISPFSIFSHEVAVGMNDFAGTGLFSSEYIVATNIHKKLEYSIGLSWGGFSKGIAVPNPLISIDDGFIERNEKIRDFGGNFQYSNFFSGKEASIFFGTSYKVNDRLFLLMELDPTNTTNEQIPYKAKTTKFNFAINRQFDDLAMKISFQRGVYVGFQFSYFFDAANFNQRRHTNIPNNSNSYEEIQKILEVRDIGLKKIYSEEDTMLIDIRQVSYFDQNEANNIVVESLGELAKSNNFEEIVVSQYFQGMKISSSGYDVNFKNPIGDTIISNPNDLYLIKDYFPYFNSSIYPSIRNFIAGREGFYFGGLFLENDIQLSLKENILLLTNLKYSVWDNFRNLQYPPLDTYPEQVRSDNKDYLKSFNRNITLGRLEINHFHSPKKHHYFRTSAGIFEEMFGGYGIDYVYSPENSIFSLGLEAYYVRKRNYDMKFGFKKYSNFLARGIIQLQEPKTNVRFRLSFGEYLAGDVGYTFQVKRNFKNGTEYGVFFSRTNVSKEQFGEGTFDKGIFIRVPFPNIFGGQKQLGKYQWRPLTKDPAALLIKSIDLMDEVDRYRFY